MKMDEALRGKLIESAFEVLQRDYLFPDALAKLEKKVRAHVAAQRYDGIKSPEKLAKVLSEDVAEVLRNNSVQVVYSAEPLPEDSDGEMDGQTRGRAAQHAAQWNAFIDRVERLAGNVGYVRIGALLGPMVSAGPFAAAMAFAADTEELILDLRACASGDSEGVAMVIGHLVDGPVHVSDAYERARETTRQYWTSSIAGRYGKPVYVLVSNEGTRGAGEELAFSLQKLKRAKVVGEATLGRTLQFRRRRLATNFALIVATGRTTSALAAKSWENVGVKPDVNVPANAALDAAHLAALRAIRKRTDPKKMPKDFWPSFNDEIDRALQKAEARAPGKKKAKKR